MSSKVAYPSAKLHDFVITAFVQKAGMRLLGVASNKSWSQDSRDRGEDYEYRLAYPGAATIVKISLHWPGANVHIALVKGRSWFSFANYLRYQGRQQDLERILARRLDEQQPITAEEAAIEVLQLFADYLGGDLLPLARGSAWVDIPLEWGAEK